jgi:hypothetical protein
MRYLWHENTSSFTLNDIEGRFCPVWTVLYTWVKGQFLFTELSFNIIFVVVDIIISVVEV